MESTVELDIAGEISNQYKGNLVTSKHKNAVDTEIEVVRLNNLLVKVQFKINNQTVNFRGRLTESNEGILMMVEQKITNNYIISGLSGFMHERPNVHGGFLNRLNSFYFHIVITQFSGEIEEFYFVSSQNERLHNPEQAANQEARQSG